MTDLNDLYREVILDHYRHPRNFGALAEATAEAKGHNPLCGDRIDVFLTLDNEVIVDISFEGAGCAISTASASLMTDAVKGKSLTEARGLFEAFHQLVTGSSTSELDSTSRSDDVELGKLEALSGVRQLPVRVKCATLAWHTFQAAVDRSDSEAVEISTE